MRVLIVEDEALIRMLVCDLLEQAGFECRDVGDAAEAIAVLECRSGCRPDLLVTDYNLGPGPNGMAVALEARRRLPELPIVYATGNPECLAGHLLGARERVVVKPFTSDELVAAVHEVRLPSNLWLAKQQQTTALPWGAADARSGVRHDCRHPYPTYRATMCAPASARTPWRPTPARSGR